MSKPADILDSNIQNLSTLIYQVGTIVSAYKSKKISLQKAKETLTKIGKLNGSIK